MSFCLYRPAPEPVKPARQEQPSDVRAGGEPQPLISGRQEAKAPEGILLLLNYNSLSVMSIC